MNLFQRFIDKKECRLLASAVSLDFHNLMTVMASSAVGEAGLPGGDSFVQKKADSVTSFKDLRFPTAG